MFAHGPYALKLYRKGSGKDAVFREAAVLAALESTGLPVPKVVEGREFDDGWGLVMTRAPGLPFADAMLADPRAVPGHLVAMAKLHRAIHAQHIPSLRSLKGKLAHNIGRAAQLSEDQRRALLGTLAALSDGDRLCHGDFHPHNVIGTIEDAVVIDWLDAASGPPEADLCRSFVLMHHVDRALAEAYLAAYPADIKPWLPVVAAARLAEGVPAEEGALLAFVGGQR